MWQRAAGGHTDWQGLSQPLYDLLPDGKMYHAVQWDICPGITGRRDQRERYNRRICSANGGLPPMTKRKKYYESLGQVA